MSALLRMHCTRSFWLNINKWFSAFLCSSSHANWTNFSEKTAWKLEFHNFRQTLEVPVKWRKFLSLVGKSKRKITKVSLVTIMERFSVLTLNSFYLSSLRRTSQIFLRFFLFLNNEIQTVACLKHCDFWNAKSFDKAWKFLNGFKDLKWYDF